MNLYVDVAFVLLSIVMFALISIPSFLPNDWIRPGPKVLGSNLKVLLLRIVAVFIFVGSMASILKAKGIIHKDTVTLINDNTNGLTTIILLSLVWILVREKKKEDAV